jgi:hypothetical protein
MSTLPPGFGQLTIGMNPANPKGQNDSRLGALSAIFWD